MAIDMNYETAMIEHHTDGEGRTWRVIRGEGDEVALLAKDIRNNLALGVNRAQVENAGGEALALASGLAFTTESLIAWIEHHGRGAAKKALLRTVIEGVLEPVTNEGDEGVEDDGFRTIDWESFVYDEGGVKGISLRALVDAGLYSRMEKARLAAEGNGWTFAHVVQKSTGGRPAEDLIFQSVRDAQKFCMRSRTDLGEQIADLILDHHDDFQKLLAGDEETWERTERHRERVEPKRWTLEEFQQTMMMSVAAQGQQLTQLLSGMGQISGEVKQVDRRVEELETASSGKRPHELYIADFAAQVGIYSKGPKGALHGHAHSQAMGHRLRIGLDGVDSGYLRLAKDIPIPGEERRTDIHFVTPTAQDDVLAVMQCFDDVAVRQLGSAMLIAEYAVTGRTYTVLLDADLHRKRQQARARRAK